MTRTKRPPGPHIPGRRRGESSRSRRRGGAGGLAFVGLAGGLLLLLTSAPVAWAEHPPAASLLPKQTFFYARTPSVAGLKAHFAATTTGRMVADEQIRPFLTGVWKVFADEFADRAAEQDLDVTLDDLSGLVTGEVSVAAVALRGEGIRFAAILDVDPESDVSERLILWARSRGEADPLRDTTEHRGYEIQEWAAPRGGPLHVCRRDDTYLVSNSLNLVHGMLDLWDGIAVDADGDPVPTLGKSSQFMTVTKRLAGGMTEEPDVLLYGDPIEGVRAFYGETPAGFAALAMIPALGLDGLRAAGISIAFDTPEFDSLMRAHVVMDRPRIGVLEAIALGEVDPTPADFVPDDVVTHVALQVDREATIEAVAEIYDSYTSEDGFSKWIDRTFSRNLGIDVEREFLPLVQGRLVYASWVEPSGQFNAGSHLFAVRMLDPAAARDLLARVFKKAEDQNPESAPKSAQYAGQDYWVSPDQSDRQAAERERRRAERVERALREGRTPPVERYQMDARVPRMTVAVLGDDLVICDSETYLQHALDAYRGEAGRFRDSLSYLAVTTKLRRILGGRAAAAIQVDNSEQALRQWYDFAVGEQTRAFLDDRTEERFFGRLGTTMAEAPLPPFETFQSYVSPSGSVLLDEETGLHYMNFTIRRDPEPRPPAP